MKLHNRGKRYQLRRKKKAPFSKPSIQGRSVFQKHYTCYEGDGWGRQVLWGGGGTGLVGWTNGGGGLRRLMWRRRENRECRGVLGEDNSKVLYINSLS